MNRDEIAIITTAHDVRVEYRFLLLEVQFHLFSFRDIYFATKVQLRIINLRNQQNE